MYEGNVQEIVKSISMIMLCFEPLIYFLYNERNNFENFK